MKKLIYILLALVLTVGSLLTAGAQPGPTPTPKTPTLKPQYGGVLRIISSTMATNLGAPTERYNPLDSVFGGASVQRLLRVDERGVIVPYLANAWQISPDLKSITLTLRKGVKFHDETDFNAEAAKYNLDVYRTSAKAELKAVASVEIVDVYTVRLNLSQFDSQIIPALAMRAGWMVSPTAYKTQGKEWLMTHPVGTGPFKFVSFQRDVSLKYERFDGYWQKGKPYLDGVEFIFIADPTVAQMAFTTGQAQLTMGIPAKVASDLQAIGYKIGRAASAVYGLAGDSGHPHSPLADIRVRRAVAYAIDTEAIVKAVYHGFSPAVNQPGSPESWYYNPAVVGYPYNPPKAKDLLAQAGYSKGFKTRIIFPTSESKDFFTAVQGYLSQVGIDAKLEVVSMALYVQTLTAGWDNGLINISMPTGMGYDPGQTLLTRLSSRAEQFVSIIRPAAYEAKLSQALGEPEFGKRKLQYQELMKLIVDEHAMLISTNAGYSLSAKSPAVHDSRLHEFWSTNWTPEDAWLSK